jgi:phosphatidylglycerophosphatase A
MSARLARLLATVAGLGDVLPAPGTTVGSIVGAAALTFLLHLFTGHPAVVVLAGLAALLPAAVWSCGVEAARRGETDPRAIVLDEVVGQWLALGLVAMLRPEPVTVERVILSFALFRVADVLKPWPIRRLERLPGGWGIVVDDLAAGVLAAVVELVLLGLL